MALTDAAIKNAKPRTKPYKLADEKGLHLLVQSSGGLLWRMKYRADGSDDRGKPKRVEKLLSFGRYPDESSCRRRTDPGMAKLLRLHRIGKKPAWQSPASPTQKPLI